VFSYGIKVSALNKVINLKDSTDTEVWYQYFTDTGLFNVVDLEIENIFHKRPGLRMTLDYPDDWTFFQCIFDELYNEDELFTLDEILELLDERPEIIKINENCSKKFNERYSSQSLINLKKVRSINKALIIGCGSIGQRHVKNLNALGVNNIIALRSKKGHFKNLPDDINVTEIEGWDKALNEKPDIAIISNPTSLHLESLLKLLPTIKGIFVEKPLSHSMDGIDKLLEVKEKYKNVIFVGHNLMFHPIIKTINDFIGSHNLGEMLNIQCQFGQWLPGWHPYEKYEDAYYARKDLGGGVTLTLIHELHMAVELAGEAIEVAGFLSDSSMLNLDVDVISDVMVRHKSGCVSQIHLDYVQQPQHRSGLISFERGWISYDYNQSKVIAQGPDDNMPYTIWSDDTYDANEMYIEEIKTFIQYVEENRVIHCFDSESAIESLKLVDALFMSSANKNVVKVPYNKRFKF
jgi:predicted dehydrogenase